MTKLYIYAAIGLAIAGILAHDHWLSRKLKAANEQVTVQRLRADQAEIQVKAEQEARKHEQTIAKQASDAYQADLARIRAEPDFGVVRLCRKPSLPPAGSPTGASSGPDVSPSGHVESEDATDIGPMISAFVEDCEANASQLESLQRWVLSR